MVSLKASNRVGENTSWVLLKTSLQFTIFAPCNWYDSLLKRVPQAGHRKFAHLASHLRPFIVYLLTVWNPSSAVEESACCRVLVTALLLLAEFTRFATSSIQRIIRKSFSLMSSRICVPLSICSLRHIGQALVCSLVSHKTEWFSFEDEWHSVFTS